MKAGMIRVATCQFSIGPSAARNAAQICRQIAHAARRGATVAHFPESALCGYAGSEVPSWRAYDWDALRAAAERVCDAARRAKMWVIVGGSHRLTGRHKPHNCLYIIDPSGSLVDRYDKCFCTGGDLRNYSPGDHLTVFSIHGVRCGALICYDVRFPELYRAYAKRGVQCMFHSFHNAAGKAPTIHTTIMRPSLQARAATNYMWVSAPNCSRYYQLWPSVFIQPDGAIAASLRFHRAGVTVNTVDTHKQYYDAPGRFRGRAMRGILHSGTLVKDPRTGNRTSL
jgi:predicted amidohydrolase